MSLVVSSTTDSQEAVNAAAGIEAPPEEQAQKPTPVPLEDPDTEEEEPEDPDEEDSDKPVAEQNALKREKPKGGFQRKIERLQAQNEQREQRIRELEAERQRYAPPPQQPQQQPAGPPKAEDYPNDYEAYNRAVIRYEARQEIEQELKSRVEAQRQQAEQKAQQEIDQRWHQGVSAMKQQATDFEDTLESVSHIILPPWIEAAIKRDPNGAHLAYELARHPEEFQKIAEIPNPLEGISALGEFRGSIKSQAAAPRGAEADLRQGARKVASDAPAPIRPVGQSVSGTRVTRSLDELSYQDYKRAREREIKARKQR
jgi:hypothetical protein